MFFANQQKNLSFSVYSDIAKELNEPISDQEIKNLIDKSQTNSKEIDFNEFYQIENDNNNEKENNEVVYLGRKKILKIIMKYLKTKII